MLSSSGFAVTSEKALIYNMPFNFSNTAKADLRLVVVVVLVPLSIKKGGRYS